MKSKETLNLYRVLSVMAVILVTLGVTTVISLDNHFYTDEWLCLLFLDIIFILIYIFELEYERRRGRLAGNTQSRLTRLALVYAVCALLSYAMAFFPEFGKPVILIPILMCAVSSSTMAIVVGIFYDVVLIISAGGNLHALIAMSLLTVLGGVLADALSQRRYRRMLSLLIVFLNMMIPGIFYYMSYKEMDNQIYIYSAINGVVSGLTAYLVYPKIREGTRHEVDNQLLDIVSEEYSEVKALKDFSILEYRHAKKVAEVAFHCAKEIGCNPNLCLAAGFYYRMGRWLGEPYNENAQKKARGLCFPDAVVQILSEYYGEEQLPSSPESALVHMVDALVKKLDAINESVGKTAWNHDILIYQTLNEFSETGIYDGSGMSMNQFLKAREFLAKEELLQ